MADNSTPGTSSTVSPADIVAQLKSGGVFDKFRRDCLAEAGDLSVYRGLKHRVGRHVTDHLLNNRYKKSNLTKNQLRDQLRQDLMNHTVFLKTGVKSLVELLINERRIEKDIRPEIEQVVRRSLGLDPIRNTGKYSTTTAKDDAAPSTSHMMNEPTTTSDAGCHMTAADMSVPGQHGIELQSTDERHADDTESITSSNVDGAGNVEESVVVEPVDMEIETETGRLVSTSDYMDVNMDEEPMDVMDIINSGEALHIVEQGADGVTTETAGATLVLDGTSFQFELALDEDGEELECSPDEPVTVLEPPLEGQSEEQQRSDTDIKAEDKDPPAPDIKASAKTAEEKLGRVKDKKPKKDGNHASSGAAPKDVAKDKHKLKSDCVKYPSHHKDKEGKKAQLPKKSAVKVVQPVSAPPPSPTPAAATPTTRRSSRRNNSGEELVALDSDVSNDEDYDEMTDVESSNDSGDGDDDNGDDEDDDDDDDDDGGNGGSALAFLLAADDSKKSTKERGSKVERTKSSTVSKGSKSGKEKEVNKKGTVKPKPVSPVKTVSPTKAGAASPVGSDDFDFDFEVAVDKK